VNSPFNRHKQDHYLHTKTVLAIKLMWVFLDH